MARTVRRLSALAVKRAAEPGMYADGGGLVLQVTGAGARSWIYRYQQQGRERQMGLGSLTAVPLSDARRKAAECRSQRAAGIDPIQARDALRATTRASKTFAQCAGTYIESHRAGWRHPKHSQAWENTLAAHVSPIFGHLPVQAVDTDAVLRALKPIWNTLPETASRVRSRIEIVLDWAKVSGYRDGENPARWRGHLDHLLPAPSKVQRIEHHAAMPYAELSTFMATLREQTGVAVRALEFTILTAARTGEVIGATWDEIDPAQELWTVPPERMKAGKEHRVPLVGRALAILKTLPRESQFVFPNRRGRQLPERSLRSLLERTEVNATVHGFRSTFRDWCADTTAYPNHVVEMALAHSIGNKVEAAYRRGDLFDKRRALMQQWGSFCDRRPAGATTAVPIRASA